jgi:hypothetical protein
VSERVRDVEDVPAAIGDLQIIRSQDSLAGTLREVASVVPRHDDVVHPGLNESSVPRFGEQVSIGVDYLVGIGQRSVGMGDENFKVPSQ